MNHLQAKMIKVFKILFWILIMAGVGVVLYFAVTERHKLKCSGFEVVITDDNGNSFINEDEIRSLIYKYHDSLSGKFLDSIDTELIENTLCKNPYILNATVYSSPLGNVKALIERENALIRITNKYKQEYYIGENGNPLPLSKNYVPHTLVASGNIDEKYNNIRNDNFRLNEDSTNSECILTKIFLLAQYISGSEFFHAHFEQIFVNENNEFELIPVSGDYMIIFGDIDNMENKFENLLAFYKEGIPKIGWEKCKTINLKYKNQVVCK